jgi:hypothetical protein|tara:strand:- start:13693 stop:14298 length:606 start_codon:yes stop_codon:yes gene_type:complete
MIKELVKLSNHLDAKGLRKEADYLDAIIKKASEEEVLRKGDIVYSGGSQKLMNVSGEYRIAPPSKGVVYHVEMKGGKPYYLIESFDLESHREQWESEIGWEPEDWNDKRLTLESKGFHAADEDDTIDEGFDFDPDKDDPGEKLREIVEEHNVYDEEYERMARSEGAMMAGMGGGTAAYNEYMGQSLSDPDEYDDEDDIHRW